MTGSGAGVGRMRGVGFGAGSVAGGAPSVLDRGAACGSGVGCSPARLAQPHAGTQLASTIVTASMDCGNGPSYRTRDLIRRISEKGHAVID